MDANDHNEIRLLFDEYLQMYASRNDQLVDHFSEDFSGFTGGGDFLVKDLDEWVAITRQDFAQVKKPLRIDLKDLSIQKLADTIALVTSCITIQLPIKDHSFSQSIVRLVLLFRKESESWKISHCSYSLPDGLARDGEIYPLQALEERNQRLEVQIAEQNIQLSKANNDLTRMIEEQKCAEAELRLSGEKNQTILNSAMDGFTIVSSEGRFLEVNDTYCRMSGYSIQELLKMGMADVDVNESSKDVVAHNQKITEQGGDRFVSKHRRKDGTVFDVEVSATYIPSDGGLLVGFIRDITSQKEAERALLDAEWKFKALFNNGPIGVAYHSMMYDESGKPVDYYFIDANKNYLALTGVDPRGKTVTQAFPGIENDPFDWIGVFGRVAKTGESIHFEQYLVANDRWYDCVGFQYKPDHFVASFVEITARKKAEQQLEERKRLLDTLLANLPVGVFMVEAPSGQPLIANEKALELLGRGILPDTNKENLTEVYEAYKFGTHDRYPVEEMPIVRGMYGESSTVEDLLVIRPDGTSKLLGISGTPVLNADNRPWASIVCFQDITDRKEYENEQLKMQKLESLGVLAGGIAHDFNNILTGIIGNISLAKRFIDGSHKSFNALDGAEKASVRATELARQLLTFAKGGEPVKKVVSIQGVVNESVSLVLHGSNVKGNIDIPDSMFPIEADEGQISQVFHNIIINATQAMPGGGMLSISARNKSLDADNSLALSPGLYACISFTDEGCGIADADFNKIFDPYFTTKVSGNGLGLATCRSIITKHGGHIGVTSCVGQGTTFTIHLPSIRASAPECPDGSDAHFSKDHIGGAILVMDDEEIIRELAVMMLEEIGYQVTTCSDGVEAIRFYTHARESGVAFQSVIMDLTIPGGMGGKEAAKEILAIDPTACLIVSSGYSNDPIMSDYSSYGFTGAIAKPYMIDELEKLLRSSMLN
jgi:PAS domain S-box-containing protein